jgi:hypothetical protein
MVDLIILVCALKFPSTCVERHFLFEARGSLNSCMMQAQPYLARWSGENPGFRVANWRCAWPYQEEEKG